VIASLGGASRQPGWMYNLAKEPHATVEFYGGRRLDVEARTLSGEDREAAWKRIERDAPEYAKYLTKTDREIPVARLTAYGTIPSSSSEASSSSGSR
jgi:F420H(2)-dependent quinone reductase